MTDADVHFYFDPVCPFAWMTSKWVRMVAAQRGYTVDWRFISLRLINAEIDYDSHFPVGYEERHTSGLRLLRVVARARAEHGRAAIGPLYEAVSGEIFDASGAAELTAATRGSREFVAPLHHDRSAGHQGTQRHAPSACHRRAHRVADRSGRAQPGRVRARPGGHGCLRHRFDLLPWLTSRRSPGSGGHRQPRAP